MSNEAQQILKTVQYKTGKSLEEIAMDIGYSRPYLNNVKNKGGGEKIVGILKSKYYNILQNGYAGHTPSEPPAGYVKADQHIKMLEVQNEFLRRNFELSLKSIAEGQHQAGVQLKALTWYSAVTANKGDQKAADRDIARIHNKIASYEGIEDEDDSSEKDDNGRTSAKQKK